MVYSLPMEPPKGKLLTDPFTTDTVTLVTDETAEKLIVLSGPSNVYATPVVKAWVLWILPRIMPLPVLVSVMVSVLVPVEMIPLVIFTMAAEILLCNTVVVVELLVLLVRILNVVAPLIVEASPKNCTVLVPGINVPLLVQLPYRECVYEEGLKVVPV